MSALLQPTVCFTSWLHDAPCNLFEVQLEIHPGTGVVSKGWATYTYIEEIQDGILKNDVSLPLHNLVDPGDATFLTYNIEYT